MNNAHLKLSAWSGIVASVGIAVGWIFLANWIPPSDPAATATEIAAFYGEDTNMKRFGLLLAMTCTIFLIPWMIATSWVIRHRMGFPILADIQLATGILGVVATMMMWMSWGLAAFRPERLPEITLAFHDFGWFNATWFYPEATLEVIVIAIAVLSSNAKESFYPRWYGYFLIFIAMVSLSAGLMIFFKSGPFAYNGLITFWVTYACLVLFFIMGSALLIRGISKSESRDIP
ncbi:hypothetical protein FHR99_000064 [Litorivivens lipolytica]|uniref:DUF998 domain-containing protein n=1 Tax=Litorivivens lipolytica TaxID=1524264 RepID=A0A7W4Z482_9GAMM|nr:hypothetical protein [Litorivivens lipolytica]MBB3045828.1 hypothetical protein [Litorivivens lipolytica]